MRSTQPFKPFHGQYCRHSNATQAPFMESPKQNQRSASSGKERSQKIKCLGAGVLQVRPAVSQENQIIQIFPGFHIPAAK